MRTFAGKSALWASFYLAAPLVVGVDRIISQAPQRQAFESVRLLEMNAMPMKMQDPFAAQKEPPKTQSANPLLQQSVDLEINKPFALGTYTFTLLSINGQTANISVSDSKSGQKGSAFWSPNDFENNNFTLPDGRYVRLNTADSAAGKVSVSVYSKAPITVAKIRFADAPVGAVDVKFHLAGFAGGFNDPTILGITDLFGKPITEATLTPTQADPAAQPYLSAGGAVIEVNQSSYAGQWVVVSVYNNQSLSVRPSPESSGLQLQNFPNPFKASEGTKISFQLPQGGNVQVKIYNEFGAEVAATPVQRFEAGTGSIEFKPPEGMASGNYIYRLEVEGQILGAGKMVIR